MSDADDEISTISRCSSYPSNRTDAEYIVYKQRWYILLTYSFLAMMQCIVWNQWGPIFDSMEVIFNWSNTQIAVLPFYGTVAFTLFVMVCVWMTERYGLRKNIVFMASLVLTSLILRCIAVDNIKLQSALINISAILNGIAGSYTMYAPSAISAKWFPPNERKIATSIGILINGVGVAASFLDGPLAIPVPAHDDAAGRKHALNQYFRLTYVETAVTAVICLLIFVYFPSEPPTPVSPSAEEKRITSLASMKLLLKQKVFWVINIPILLILGSFLAWQPLLGISLQQNNVDQSHAGWIGCYSSVASLLTGLASAKLADKFPLELKAILVACTVVTFEGALLILLLNQGFITFSLPSIYFAVILTGAASGAFMPLSLEYAAETCYPIDEMTVTGFVGGFVNLSCSIFYAVFFIPNIATGWMTWFLFVACTVATPMVILLRPNYKRSNVDGIIDIHTPVEQVE